jgi:HEPN domain-containing protein
MNGEKREYIKNWLFRANEDISVINSLVDSGIENYTSTICFHAHQAAEKYLKAFLVFHEVDFPRTHDLDYLMLECRKINNKAFMDINLKSLTDFGVSIRYPDDFYIPAISETIYYKEIAEIIKKLLRV